MKHLLTAGALALATMTAGCATVPGSGTTVTLTPAQVIAQAQTVAAGLCAVAPTAAAITSIIVAQNTGAQASETTAVQAAQVFCAAVVNGRTVVAR